MNIKFKLIDHWCFSIKKTHYSMKRVEVEMYSEQNTQLCSTITEQLNDWIKQPRVKYY